MRSNFFAYFLALSLAGCAAEGVVVQKTPHPGPDTSLPGTEGVNAPVFRGPTGTSRLPVTATPDAWPDASGRYSFLLRDQQGNMRSQLVTAEVYARYEIGDYFNDLQPTPAAHDMSPADDGKTIAPTIHHRHATANAHRAGGTRHAHHRIATLHRHHPKKRTQISSRGAHHHVHRA